MANRLLQTSFQFGEVSDLVHAQVNSPIYMRAARRLRNVLVIPQGGITRRFGTRFQDEIEDITNWRHVKPFSLEYEDDRTYQLVFRPLAIDIYFEDVLEATVVTTYTAGEVEEMDLAQSNDLVFITVPTKSPAILTRVAHPDTWSLNATPTFIHFPQYDFTKDYNAINFQILISASPMTTAQNLLGQTVTLSASGSVFNSNHAFGLYFGDGGTLRLTAVASATSATGRIINTFDEESGLFHGSNHITGAESVLTERAFSNERGWPKKVSFFQNRIWFANTAQLPNGVFASNYNGFNADRLLFDDARADDISAITSVIRSAKKSNSIQHMVPFKTMLILSNSGVYSTPLISELPLIPTNINFINQQTADASASKVTPVLFDNEVIFFDKGGRKVKNLIINESGNHYQSNTISVLASHLIQNPTSSAVFENSTLQDGSWMFMINGPGQDPELEGTLAIYQSVPEQQVTAWTLTLTKGKFRHVSSSDEIIWFIVEREIDGDTKLYIERLDFSLFTDCTIVKTFGSPESTITGLDALEGEEVVIKSEGYPVPTLDPENSVVEDGEIELKDPVEQVEVGIPFYPLVRPMPLNVPLQIGNSIYLPKTIKTLYVDFVKSVGINVNGVLVRPFAFDIDQYNIGVTLKTDVAQVEPMMGWNPKQNIDITQSVPMPMTVVGIGYVVEVGE
jgi:hypothetical protein